ncbi:Sodium-dependent dicarboxylate transporter SdcS [Fundidesulfovibrio magnetotacticus]|uniref:Sodium-dependent dicarboxylate transporter SdcS n=1 Tax=Fundidesulfovibrio magnetotacticus TaxID=2730080 RepID=A0A6V8M1W2_9BACT|nr:DASS family sodium-coupled anion symporter [Fundidesulfovibrio magnetotacticus]GFK95926.1 Sodium-dependent dicarboxylate transporter SdcS [Fundidesulfovibrio magnetotacticus]
MANGTAQSVNTCKGGLGTYVSENLTLCGQSPKATWIGYAAAWALFFLILKVLPLPSGLKPEGMSVLAVLVWACVMWVTEAMPVGIAGISIPTLLILTRAIPWNNGNPPMGQAFSGFTTHEVWLCLFAFFAGAIIQLLRMDKRIALAILDKLKASSVGRIIWGMFWVNVVLAFLIPAANARAATVMPVVQGVTALLGDSHAEREAKKAIVIQAMVYASMISGLFILTGHMPNLIMTGLFEKSGLRNLGYFNWMVLHAPYLILFALIQWWVRVHFKTAGVSIPGGHQEISRQHRELGPMSGPEKAMLAVFAVVGLLFMTGKGSPVVLHTYQLGIVGLVGIMILFIPGLFPFKWKAVQDRTTWGTFLLLGGAITMTDAMAKSGLAAWMADHIHALVAGMNWWQTLLVMMLGTQVLRLGMLSNVAAVAMLAPIMFAMAPKVGLHPVAFTLLICNVDTFAFLLPTQITAAVIAYGTNTFSTADYARAGWVCSLLAVVFGILVMAPWYALWGLPVWNPNAPWPF